jgi:hypothetical protein
MWCRESSKNTFVSAASIVEDLFRDAHVNVIIGWLQNLDAGRHRCPRFAVFLGP